MSDKKEVTVFIASPDDVKVERELVKTVIKELDQDEKFSDVVIKSYMWEEHPSLSHKGYQEQILDIRTCEIAIFIWWSRLGSEVPGAKYEDGTTYESGTVLEYQLAMDENRLNGKPLVQVFRKKGEIENLHSDDAKMQKYNRLINWLKENAPVHREFKSKSEFRKISKNIINELVEQCINNPGNDNQYTVSRSWLSGSPFLGLKAFQLEHSPIFFGRDRVINKIFCDLENQVSWETPFFYLVYGRSGGGKSSLLRAGILPKILKGSIKGKMDIRIWRYAIMCPGKNLFQSLINALVKDDGESGKALPEMYTVELEKNLKDDSSNIRMLVKQALFQIEKNKQTECGLGPIQKAGFVLVVDQLEEIFQPDIPLSDLILFVDILDLLARCGNVWVLTSLRSDYLHKLEDNRLGKLMELKKNGAYQLMPPSDVEISQIIRLPAHAAGLKFEENNETQERLDDLLRNDAVKSPDLLPLLEFTLTELYKRRNKQNELTFDAYKSIGGIEGALTTKAEVEYNKLPKEVEDVRDEIFKELVNLNKNQENEILATRKYARKDRLYDSDTKQCFVDTFVKARLFTTDRKNGIDVVSVAHEVLLRKWNRLKKWIDDHKELLFIRFRMEELKEMWEERHKKDVDTGSNVPPLSAYELKDAMKLKNSSFMSEDLNDFFLSAEKADINRRNKILFLYRIACAALLCGLLCFIGAATSWLGWKGYLGYDIIIARNHPFFSVSIGAGAGGLFYGGVGVWFIGIVQRMRWKRNKRRRLSLIVAIVGGLFGGLWGGILTEALGWSKSFDLSIPIFSASGLIYGVVLALGIKQKAEFELFKGKKLFMNGIYTLLLLSGTAALAYTFMSTGNLNISGITNGAVTPLGVAIGQAMIFSFAHFGVFLGIYIADRYTWGIIK